MNDDQRIIELTEHLRRLTRAIENMSESINSGEFTITNTKTGEPANIGHAEYVAAQARKFFMGIE